MDENEVSALLQRVVESQDKFKELLEKKPKKDHWDKFSAISSFTSSVLLASIGGIFTHVYSERQQERERQQKATQEKIETEQKATQSRFEKDQKEQQNRISLMQFVVQVMPMLGGTDSVKQKRDHAVHILALLPDKELASKLVAEFPSTELVKDYPYAENVRALSKMNNPNASIVSNNAEGLVKSTGDAGQTILFDGFKNFGVSGFRFADKSIVAWGTDPVDIEVANADSTGSSDAVFFLERDVPPYTDPSLKEGRRPANSGIIEMAKTYEEITEAPASGYQYHYFAPKLNRAYCVLTFDGSHYAKIKITYIDHTRIGFQWQYQPSGSRSFK